MTADLKAHADRLRELHHAREMLVLPNVWDAASAKIVAEAGLPWSPPPAQRSRRCPDGEGAPWQEMFAQPGGLPRRGSAAQPMASSTNAVRVPLSPPRE